MIEIAIITAFRAYDRKMHHPQALMYDTAEFGERIRVLRQTKGIRRTSARP